MRIKLGARRSIIAAFFAFFVIASVVTIPFGEVSARAWDNRTFTQSFFQRLYNRSLQGYGWASESYVLQGGLYTYSANDFVNRLIAKNRGGTGNISQKRDVAGSAFLVHTLLGRNGDSGVTRTISDSDFNTLRERLNALQAAGRINWNTTICAGGTNTLAMGIPAGNAANRQVDILRSVYNGCEAGVVMTDASGREYKIFHRCANPVGDPATLDMPTSNFNLDPTMGLNKTSAEGGETVTLDPGVNNSGTTASTSVEWRVTTFRLNQGVAIPGGGINGNVPTTHYGNGASNVELLASQSPRAFQRGSTSLATSVAAQSIGDFPVGTRVCFALSVRPYTHSDANSWRHSVPICIVISKKPKVQVLGGDLIVGRGGTANIVTSSSTKTVGGSARTFGSWSEYGIIASGQVTSMASGAGYSGGAELNAPCNLSILTFSNVRAGAANCVNIDKPGGYSNVRSLPDIGSRLVGQTALGANPSVDVYSSTTGSYSASGTVTVSASQAIPVGKWVVINAPDATVNITSNIQYTTDTLNSLADIPQVVIIANRINIAASVTRVDAWLIASGTQGSIYTCGDVPIATNLNSNVCNQQLVVNGPVVARHIYLHRTAGSDGTSSGTSNAADAGRAAEVFNLRPDAYLWATSYTSGQARLHTVITKELPPRF